MGEATQPYREATRLRTPQILVIPAKAGFQRPSFFLFFVASWLCARYFSFARSHEATKKSWIPAPPPPPSRGERRRTEASQRRIERLNKRFPRPPHQRRGSSLDGWWTSPDIPNPPQRFQTNTGRHKQS